MIDISSCLSVSGWMSEIELTWLAQQAQIRYRIIEVGSWCGRSTRALALHTPGRVLAIDAWMFLHGSGSGNEEMVQAEGIQAAQAYVEFFRHMQEFVEKVLIMRMDSLEAAKILYKDYGPATFDMVFLDGAHDYEQVKAEILAYSPLLTPTGMLCGHDMGHAHVNKAVTELLPLAECVPGGTIWYVEMP